MSDARWLEIEDDAQAAAKHFGYAIRLHEAGGFGGEDLDGYRARMGFMHAVQAGHTSMESALVRILAMLGEERPTGEHWHQDLIRRAARAVTGGGARPPILSPEAAAAADETRRFRSLAMRSYDSFEPEKALRTVQAARLLADRLLQEIRAFRDVLDPPA